MSAITIEEAETCPLINQVPAANIGTVVAKAELHLVTETDIAQPTQTETLSRENSNLYEDMDFWQKGSIQSGAQDPYRSYSFWTGAGLLRASMEAAEKRYAAQQALRRK